MRWAGFKVERTPMTEVDDLGYCDFVNGVITVSSKLKSKKELEIFIHEGLHALNPDMSEDLVTNTARQLADLIWALGYRKET